MDSRAVRHCRHAKRMAMKDRATYIEIMEAQRSNPDTFQYDLAKVDYDIANKAIARYDEFIDTQKSLP